MAEQLTLTSLFAIARRRWLLIVGTLLVGLAATVAVAVGLPPVYESSGTILVESQQIPDELIRSTITGFADERIQLIKQRVMTRDNLLRVADKFRVFAEDHEDMSASEKVESMRSQITIELLDVDLQGKRRKGAGTIAFKLGFEHRKPEMALAVANELVTLFLDENVKARTERASETTDFLAQEAQKLRTNLEKIEEQIAAYKQEHKNALPEHLAMHTAQLERAHTELRETGLQIRELEQEQRFLEIELAAARSGVGVMQPGGVDPRGTPAAELMRLKSELAQKSAIYEPTHPDIGTLKRKIAALEKTAAAQVVSADAGGNAKGQGDKGGKAEPVDATELLAARVQAKSAATAEKIALLQGREETLKARIAELEGRIVQTPEVERGLQALNRDHENSLAKYEEIKAKQLQAQIAENLEEENKAERFLLLEPPVRPETPVKPNRQKVLGVGAFLAVAASGGGFWLAESLDHTIRGPASLAAVLRQPPLVVVPYLHTRGELARRRRRLLWGLALALALVVVVLLGLHFFYKPLDMIWLKVLSRFG